MNRHYVANKVPFSDDQKLEIAKASGVVVGGMFGAAAFGAVAAELYPAAMVFAGTPTGQAVLNFTNDACWDFWGTGQPGYFYLFEKTQELFK